VAKLQHKVCTVSISFLLSWFAAVVLFFFLPRWKLREVESTERRVFPSQQLVDEDNIGNWEFLGHDG
jgi:hypothetical protein